MHRDIKPDNLLIAKPLDGPHQLTADLIKVSDFGISVPFTPGLVSGTCAAATLMIDDGGLWATGATVGPLQHRASAGAGCSLRATGLADTCMHVAHL